MKAKEFIKSYEDSFDESMDIFEWNCPECGEMEVPDDEGNCPSCGYKHAKEIFDDRKKYWETVYDKVFSKIRSKLLEDELQGTNVLKFVNTLSRIGVIQRLRSGRYREAYKIPKEFVVTAFVEGKSGLPRLRRMVLRRQKK